MQNLLLPQPSTDRGLFKLIMASFNVFCVHKDASTTSKRDARLELARKAQQAKTAPLLQRPPLQQLPPEFDAALHLYPIKE